MTTKIGTKRLPALVELEKRGNYKEIAMLAEKLAKQASFIAKSAKKEEPLANDVFGGTMGIRQMAYDLERAVMGRNSRLPLG